MMIRQIFLFFSLVLIIFACSDDDSPSGNMANSNPSISLLITDSTIYGKDTLMGGASFDILFSASKGKSVLASWSLSLDNNIIDNYSNVPVSDFNNFTESVKNIEVPFSAGDYNYILSIKDIDGVSVETSWTITVLEDVIPDNADLSLNITDSTVYMDTILAIGTTFDISITATKGFYKLDTWSILNDGLALNGFNENDVPNDSFFTAHISGVPVPNIEGDYSYSFQISDEKGTIVNVDWQVTAADIPVFTEYKGITLGAQSNSNIGGFFLARQVQVSTLSEANASNGEAVEIFYYNGATNGPTLFSPVDPDTDGLFGGALNNWFIRFNTKIQKSAKDYSTITAQEIDESLVSGTKANQLAVGDVVLIETALGLKAILIIRNLVTGNNGSIEFDIKIVD
ncbi:hypothetical protein HZR84_06700 [Hyphobacterium sp. CCMP332]|nr:hypothetical protein HZR84_06700 [Hyphobacterium sp. CCMP332]